MRLSKNFALKELTRSQTAIRMGIENSPNTEQLVNLAILTQQILQPCRDQFGTISINSGLRVLDLNRAIGSGDKSQHTKGEAADFEQVGSRNATVAQWMEKELDFLTKVVNALPFIETTKTSLFTLEGEYAEVYPNPN